MLPKGGREWERRGHSHQRSSVALQRGAGEDEPGAGAWDTVPEAARAASKRAAWAVGLKLVRMGDGVQGGRCRGPAGPGGEATVGEHRAPAAVAELDGGQVLRVTAQRLVAGGGKAADFGHRVGVSRHGREKFPALVQWAASAVSGSRMVSRR